MIHTRQTFPIFLVIAILAGVAVGLTTTHLAMHITHSAGFFNCISISIWVGTRGTHLILSQKIAIGTNLTGGHILTNWTVNHRAEGALSIRIDIIGSNTTGALICIGTVTGFTSGVAHLRILQNHWVQGAWDGLSGRLVALEPLEGKGGVELYDLR